MRSCSHRRVSRRLEPLSSPTTADGTQWADVEVTQDATLTLDVATNFRLLTLNVAEGRTLTLAGANALTAAKIRVSGLGTVVSPASALSGMLVGGGTVAYTALPSGATVGCDWYGTLAFRGFSITGPNFNTYGNVASRVVLSGIQGWVNTGTEYVVPIVLDNGGYSFALNVDNGNSPQSPDYAEGANVNRCSVFRKISGGGSLVDSGLAAAGRTAWPVFKVYDMGSFSGSLSLDRTSIVVCDPTTSYHDPFQHVL
ncbi:MAG: hypothetical protein IKO72_11265 [Kiritimatiellae bacterium]|nr:hypothetical protein [Kiritimatiellia bacterium]